MAPDIGDDGDGLLEIAPHVYMHRVFPGPVRGMLALLERRRPMARSRAEEGLEAGADGDPGDAFAAVWPLGPARLNWKGRLLERFQHLVSLIRFPDLRGEWARPAMHKLARLLNRIRPDVVVTSHEPATTLWLGLAAKAWGARWVADLGDPVLASYTPARWRNRAAALERRTLREADHVLVTTAETQALLRHRHGDAASVTVVPQGFDDCAAPPPPRVGDARAGGTLELLYSGSFYAFRDPRALVDGVLQTDGARLNVASGNVPDWLPALAAAHPGKLRLLGRVPHRRLLALQRRADVLVNIANVDPAQIPGKVYEYFGACRPILHLQSEPGDAVGGLLARLRRGVACAGGAAAVAAALSMLVEQAREGRLDRDFELDLAPVEGWGWTGLAGRVEQVLHQVVADPPE